MRLCRDIFFAEPYQREWVKKQEWYHSAERVIALMWKKDLTIEGIEPNPGPPKRVAEVSTDCVLNLDPVPIAFQNIRGVKVISFHASSLRKMCRRMSIPSLYLYKYYTSLYKSSVTSASLVVCTIFSTSEVTYGIIESTKPLSVKEAMAYPYPYKQMTYYPGITDKLLVPRGADRHYRYTSRFLNPSVEYYVPGCESPKDIYLNLVIHVKREGDVKISWDQKLQVDFDIKRYFSAEERSLIRQNEEMGVDHVSMFIHNEEIDEIDSSSSDYT